MASVAVRHKSQHLNLNSNHTLFKKLSRLYSSSSSNNGNGGNLDELRNSIQSIRLSKDESKDMTLPQGEDKEVANSTRNHSRWSLDEDRALVSAMQHLVDLGGLKADSGKFKRGAYAKIEHFIKQKLPGCGKKVRPHIEGRLRLFRKQYDAITEMLSPQASGFGWNDDGKFITCDQAVWDAWIKDHKYAAGLRYRPFPLFDELGKIIGKDRSIGNETESLQDGLGDTGGEERNDQKDEQVTSSDIHGTSSTSPIQVEPPPSTTPLSLGAKTTKTDIIEALREFSTKLNEMSNVMEAAGEHIGRLANCFKHESKPAERRMQVTSEVMKIEGLSSTEVLLASKKIASNPLEVDFFFSLPNDSKYAYVRGLLIPDQATDQH